MIKKSITYDDYNGNTVTEEFYFNFTKLEVAEKELELGGLKETLDRIVASESTKEAYALFKDILLSSYGVKHPDGRRFIKTAALTEEFSQTPALAELIFEFLENPEMAGAFIESVLPSKMVAEGKAREAKAAQEGKAIETVELPTPEGTVTRMRPPLLESSTISEKTNKELTEMTKEELIEAMNKASEPKPE